MTLLLDDPLEAAALVRAGGIVAFPTETVYGLGARTDHTEALARVFSAKGRPSDNPLIVHLARFEDVLRVADAVPPHAHAFAAAFVPGPLTLVLPRRPDLPSAVTAGLPAVGVRVPGLALARTFLDACGGPVAAPSANRSGRPSPTTWGAVMDDLNGRIDAVLRGPGAERGLESTVVDVTGAHPVVLRAGAVSLEALCRVVPSTVMAAPGADLAARSPGTRHRHYAPRARVWVAEAWREGAVVPAAWIGLENPPDGPFARTLVLPDADAYARALYAYFRACDADGIATILCAPVPETGIGRALMDRLRRAAEG